jgi:steroid delta-isomerase-like uncharacterized protein
MSEQNKAIVKRVIDEVWNRRNLDAVDELYAAGYTDRSPGVPPGMESGPEGVKQFVAMFTGGFPDAKGGVEEVIAEGDKVVVRWTGSGTHEGEFMGVPASGKHVTFSGTSTYRIANGQIAEEWTHFDGLGLMTQIGAIPESPAG